MLMMDRITDISGDAGLHGKGHVVAEFDIHPDLGSFPATSGNPIMPGCLGLDGLWQLTGFNLGWRGWQGRGYALGVARPLTGMVRPDRKMLRYYVDLQRPFQTRRLTMGVADGRSRPTAKPSMKSPDMKVALSARPIHEQGTRHAPRRHHRAGHRLSPSATTPPRSPTACAPGAPGIVFAP